MTEKEILMRNRYLILWLPPSLHLI